MEKIQGDEIIARNTIKYIRDTQNLLIKIETK